MLFHDYFYTCNAQKNKKVSAEIYTEGEWSGLVRGISLPSEGRVWEGAVPPPQKILEILPENGAFWLHFLQYARFSICLVYFCSSRIFFRKQMVKIP